MYTYDQLKNTVLGTADALASSAKELALYIHQHPEISSQETETSTALCAFLKKQGLHIIAPFVSLPTAFKAKTTGQGHCIALVAEYDALPQIGHGCGHNLIAAASALAAVSLLPILDQINGQIAVIGTPAEERGSFKIEMIKNGAFDDVEVALMAHPNAVYSSATIDTYAITEINVTFTGKASHAAAAPHEGLNALDAVISSFNAIGALRQQMPENCRLHGIITHGGDAPNIIPAKASAAFMVRSKDSAYLKTLVAKVCQIFQGAALQTGTKVQIDLGDTCLNMLNNKVLAETYIDAMAELGRSVPFYNDNLTFGSTDMGNLSHKIHAIHPIFAITEQSIAAHTVEFTQAASSEQALNEMVLTAKGLALAALKYFLNEDLRRLVVENFKESR